MSPAHLSSFAYDYNGTSARAPVCLSCNMVLRLALTLARDLRTLPSGTGTEFHESVRDKFQVRSLLRRGAAGTRESMQLTAHVPLIRPQEFLLRVERYPTLAFDTGQRQTPQQGRIILVEASCVDCFSLPAA